MIRLKYFLVSIVFLFGCSGGDRKMQNTTTSTPLHIVCIGDSITEGYGLTDPSIQSYPSQLSRLVAEGVKVQNFGIRGASVLKKSNTPYWNTSHYQRSLREKPDIVIIMLGTNDLKDINWKNKASFISDYTALIESYKHLESSPTIYICLPPPVYANIQGITNKRMVEELIPKLRKISMDNGISMIDIFTQLSNKELLFPDKIHPNKEGASQIAQYVYQAIY